MKPVVVEEFSLVAVITNNKVYDIDIDIDITLIHVHIALNDTMPNYIRISRISPCISSYCIVLHCTLLRCLHTPRAMSVDV